MRIKGFTLVEITAVAAIVASLSLGGYQIVKKGKDSVCLNNLKQIGQAVAMFEADHDGLPDAVFYPGSAGDPRGINNILKRYGTTPDIFFCPAISTEFNKYGTNYLWNESAKRTSSNSSGLWLMTEITALYPELPSPHTGGYGVLYADGHASIDRNINFPPFQRPSLASTIKTEKQKEEKEPVEEKKEIVGAARKEFKEYQILNLPSKVESGKPVSISIKSIDIDGNIYESNERLRMIDLTGSIEPSDVVLDKGIANIMIHFTRLRKNNVLFVVDSKGKWQCSKEFEIEAGSPAVVQIIPSSNVYVGVPTSIRVIVKDSYGNIILKKGLKLSIISTYEAEYPSSFVSDVDGTIDIPVIFHKSGENRITVLISGTTIKDSCSIKVSPGVIDHFEISRINSPVEAGKPVSITVKALDKYGNRIKGLFFIGDSNVPSYLKEDVSSGIWMETISFEKSTSETSITVGDVLGHTGRSNTFSVVPSYPTSIKILEYDPVVIENQEFQIGFVVNDRYNNSISGLESYLSVRGLDEYKITGSAEQYTLVSKIQKTGKKDISIFLKKNNDEILKFDFTMFVLPLKPVIVNEKNK